jgi:glutaminase
VTRLDADLDDVVIDLRAPDASPVLDYIRALYDEYSTLGDGDVATYIPELETADPSWFGICVVTVDGHRFEVGDTDVPFTIQSISKPFVYGIALEDRGVDAVLQRVGVEPSGDVFNSIVVDASNRPFNPMVNAGAIVTAGLVKGSTDADQIARVDDTLARYAGRRLHVDPAVFASERATGDRNRAIAYLMRSFGMIDGDVDATVDRYFRQCSVVVTTRDLAMMAATLANRGRNPVTGDVALDDHYLEHVLSVMSTCGMYDYAGEWAYTVGLPAKSGVAGGVIAVLPGQFGIGVFSPRLDGRGNSVRGVRVCQRFASDFSLHPMRFQPEVGAVVRSSHRGSDARSHRVRPNEEYQLLATRGDAIRVLELQGDLFFGSAERVFRTVVEDLDGVEYVVLDLKRVGTIDDAAATILANLATALDAADRVLVVAHVAGRDDAVLGMLAARGSRLVADTDLALEWCEERVLSGTRDLAAVPSAALDQQALFDGLSPEALAAIEARVTVPHAGAGDLLIEAGAPADALFFVLSGSASVWLTVDGDTRGRRLTTLGPGVEFGELALLDEGVRSASVFADGECVIARLGVDDLRALESEQPGVVGAIYRNLARNLAGRLRRANEQLRTLAR